MKRIAARNIASLRRASSSCDSNYCSRRSSGSTTYPGASESFDWSFTPQPKHRVGRRAKSCSKSCAPDSVSQSPAAAAAVETPRGTDMPWQETSSHAPTALGAAALCINAPLLLHVEPPSTWQLRNAADHRVSTAMKHGGREAGLTLSRPTGNQRCIARLARLSMAAERFAWLPL